MLRPTHVGGFWLDQSLPGKSDGDDPHDKPGRERLQYLWPLVLAFSMPVMAYGIIYNALLIVAGAAIAVLAIYGWALEPADAEESDFDPPDDGGEPSKELVASG